MLQFVRNAVCVATLFVLTGAASTEAQTLTYRGTATVDMPVYNFSLQPIGNYRFTVPVVVSFQKPLSAGGQTENNPLNFTIGSTPNGRHGDFVITSAVVANASKGKYVAGSWTSTLNSQTGDLSGTLRDNRVRESITVNQLWVPQQIYPNGGYVAKPTPLADGGRTTMVAKLAGNKFAAVISGNTSDGLAPFQILVQASR